MVKYVPSKFKKGPEKPVYKEPTPAELKNLAFELARYLAENKLFDMARIYVRTSKKSSIAKNEDEWLTIELAEEYCSHPEEWDTIVVPYRKKDYKYRIRTDLRPQDYIDYTGRFLSMSFEGQLYEALNYSMCYEYSYLNRVEEHLSNFFAHYGLHYELGNAWNFSLYT